MRVTDGGVNDGCVLLQENEDLQGDRDGVRGEPQN